MKVYFSNNSAGFQLTLSVAVYKNAYDQVLISFAIAKCRLTVNTGWKLKNKSWRTKRDMSII